MMHSFPERSDSRNSFQISDFHQARMGQHVTTTGPIVREHHFVDTDTAFFQTLVSAVFLSQVSHRLHKLLVTFCFLQSYLCWNFGQGSLSLEFGAKPQARSAEQSNEKRKAFLSIQRAPGAGHILCSLHAGMAVHTVAPMQRCTS